LEQAVVELPRVSLSPGDCRRLYQGQAVDYAESPDVGKLLSDESAVAVYDSENQLVAVASLDSRQRLLCPAKVLAPA